MGPKEWKSATVVPIHKKGSKREAGNYRPVFLTSIPWKILESIVKVKLLEHLITNNLIRSTQHRFMPGRSWATNLISFLENVTEAKNRGKSVDVVYLNFSKAFDKVPHKSKGVSEEVARWIEHWLAERMQRVRVGGEMSEEREVGLGVPQGTVLGRCLFSVFIDDADKCTVGSTNIIKFADDIKWWKVLEKETGATSYPGQTVQMGWSVGNNCQWRQMQSNAHWNKQPQDCVLH
jgi:hypothetical protein